MMNSNYELTLFIAEEWENWLYYFSVPIMTSFLPNKYKKHWLDFVDIMQIIGAREVDEDELEMGIF